MITRPHVQIIAEIGSVHDGSLGNAIKLVEAAATCGADAVKFQTHIASAETTRDAPAPAYFSAENRFSYFDRTGFDHAQWQQIVRACDELGVEFLSSPFSEQAVDLLAGLGMKSWKIPSGEVTNLPMLKKIAALQQRVLLSSGMSNWAELDAAVNVLNPGSHELIVMQCSSIYPCPPQSVGLNVLNEMQQRWHLPVGYSDHTTSAAACLAAVVTGAVVIEKHFTFSRLMYGSDAQHSMEPRQFAEMVSLVRETETMLDRHVDKDDIAPYESMKSIFQKSLVAAIDLKAGTILESRHLAVKKPGTGVSASQYDQVLGRRLNRPVRADQLILPESLEN